MVLILLTLMTFPPSINLITLPGYAVKIDIVVCTV
jgi:hypothetical protein